MAGPQGMDGGDARSSPATGFLQQQGKTRRYGSQGREKLRAAEKEQKRLEFGQMPKNLLFEMWKIIYDKNWS